MASASAFKRPEGFWHGQIAEAGRFPAEKGRYHLYIGLFCPFAHRANLIRHLKGLTEIVDISVVRPYPKGDDKGWPGWKFPTAEDPYEVYFKEKKDYEGRYSVPVVWDKKTNRLVNNESLEILRNWNTGFDSILPDEYKKRDYYPARLREKIDEFGEWMQADLNTGVYKAGFALTQDLYDENVVPVFRALNRLEKILEETGGPYILGPDLTELDLQFYPTLIRFDTVYVQHFKCNLGTIRHNYPLLNEWMKNLYWNVPGFKETTDFRHIKENTRERIKYTKSHPKVNPLAITPLGPIPHIESGFEPDWSKIQAGGVNLPEKNRKGRPDQARTEALAPEDLDAEDWPS